MPNFLLRVVDANRGSISVRVLAADRHAAVRAAGVAASQVLQVELEDDAKPAVGVMRDNAFAIRTRRFPLRLFSRELAVLLHAGIPLLEGLITLCEKESSPTVAATLAAVVADLQAGQPLSAALRSQPQAFDELFIAVVESAEKTGQTERALHEHATYLASVEDLRGKLVGASIYPALLVVSGTAVVLFLLIFVMPRFAGLLEGTAGGAAELPAASRWLIGIGSFSGAHPWATVFVGVALLFAPMFAWRQAKVRSALLGQLWKLPLLGPKLHVLALAKFYRTVGMLLGAGVPLVSALHAASGVIAERLRPALRAATQAINEGERLSAALERQGLTTPVALRMLRVGERSGELAQMLGQAAAFHDDEISQLTDLLTRLVNPLLMLAMGLVIGGIVVLMYLPIFQLVEQVQ